MSSIISILSSYFNYFLDLICKPFDYMRHLFLDLNDKDLSLLNEEKQDVPNQTLTELESPVTELESPLIELESPLIESDKLRKERAEKTFAKPLELESQDLTKLFNESDFDKQHKSLVKKKHQDLAKKRKELQKEQEEFSKLLLLGGHNTNQKLANTLNQDLQTEQEDQKFDASHQQPQDVDTTGNDSL